MQDIDYKGVFSRTLYELICEVFPAHGVTEMPDDEFDAMVAELARDHFWPTVSEHRRKHGLNALGGMRFRW